MSDPRFIDDEELVGRTVAKVLVTRSYVYLTFTDGSWTAITWDGGYYAGETEIAFDEPAYDDDLRKLGIPPLTVTP